MLTRTDIFKIRVTKKCCARTEIAQSHSSQSPKVGNPDLIGVSPLPWQLHPASQCSQSQQVQSF